MGVAPAAPAALGDHGMAAEAQKTGEDGAARDDGHGLPCGDEPVTPPEAACLGAVGQRTGTSSKLPS